MTVKTSENKEKQSFCVDDSICLPDSDNPRVLIIGGGFAGLSLVKHLKKKAFQVVMVDRNNYHQFQPLLYQVATSGLEPDSIAFPFRKQFSGQGNAVFRMAEVLEIDAEKKQVLTNKGSICYDYLVIATGTRTNFFGMKNIQKNSLGMKNIRDSLNIRHKMLENLEKAAITCNQAERDALTNFVIVGGGPAGVEMAGALAEFCKFILPKDYPEYPASIMNIYLIEGSSRLILGMSQKASSKTLKYLQELNVKILFQEIVVDFDGETVVAKSGKRIATKNLIWTAGVMGQTPSGIDQAHYVNGKRLKTNRFLQVEGMEDVFAIGDIAAIISEGTPKGHPQVAQPAIQQGKVVANNLVNTAAKKDLVPFVYRDKGSLATVGKRRAVADLGKLHFGGYAAWVLWSVVHLMSISGFRNRLVVALNWMVSYFSYEKSNRLIIRSSEYEREDNE